MGASTAIAWTDHTFNPWWGCARVSPGCNHCYAETFAKRTGHDLWGKGGERRFFGDKHWAEPIRWNRQAEADGRRHRVFCASMADVFEKRADLTEHRERLFRLIEDTPWLDWQLLTKRPENIARLAPDRWNAGFPENVWIGTTVEDQQRAQQRIPVLLAVPVATRFLSCEPLLGPVDLSRWLGLEWSEIGECWGIDMFSWLQGEWGPARGISWVIVGGESGPHHRPLDLDHARTLRDQCLAADVPFFFKQVGGRTPTAGGDLLDGVAYKEFPACGEVAS